LDWTDNQIMPATDPLEPDRIKANLNTRRIGSEIIVYDSTSNTNDVAAEYAKSGKNDGLAIFAEEQTSGRGRAGNKWICGKADGLICSIVLTKSRCSAELLSLACAVAVAETIGKQGKHRAKIKWPNDITINGKKAAGILIESDTSGDVPAYVVGIGINCHQKQDSFPPELQPLATSIDIESGTLCDRVSLAKRLLTSIDHWLEIAEQTDKKVIDQWRKLSIQLGHRVTLVFNGRKFTGHCIGIDPDKGLTLQLDNGTPGFFPAAHTTVVR